MNISALKAAQTGMRRQADAFDAAVWKVTSATLADEGQPTEPGAPPGTQVTNSSDQLLTGMTDMIIAQRLFMANLRAAQAADEMLEAATRIGD